MAHSVDWMNRIDDYDVLRMAHVMQATRMSNKQMADKLHVTDKTIANWLSGVSRPNAENRDNLLTYLNRVKNKAFATVVLEVEEDC